MTLSLGSGIIVTDDGYILTNEHVTGEKYSKCYVTLENGEEYSGRVIWADSDIDLSIVKIEKAGLTPLMFRKFRRYTSRANSICSGKSYRTRISKHGDIRNNQRS